MGKRGLTCLACLLVGCGTTADIRLHDGQAIEGQIVESDQYTITVESGGEETRIERREIRIIDHPGNVALTLGVLLTAYGGLNIAGGASKCEAEGAAYCLGVFAPAAIGFVEMLYGIGVYRRSVSAAKPNRRGLRSGQMSLRVSPLVQWPGGPGMNGALVGTTF